MTWVEQLQADGLFYALNALGFVVVVLVTWLLVRGQQAKALAALQEQQKNVELAASGVFLTLQEGIDREREALRRLVQLLELAVANEEQEEAQTQRLALMHRLLENYRPKVARQVQLWQNHYSSNQQQQQTLAEQTLVPFLETSRQVIAAINAKAVLQILPNSQAFVGEEQDFKFAFDALQNCGLKHWAKQYKRALALEPSPETV